VINMDWKNLVERALWTFLEAFLAALPSTITMEVPAAGWVAVLLGAACAGLSAVKTLLVEWVSRKVAAQKAAKPPDAPTEMM
jgi:hypothetical protein